MKIFIYFYLIHVALTVKIFLWPPFYLGDART